MKQYTSEIQTAKLIELGVEKPKMAAPALKWVDGEPTFEPQYTIGELIEMLPTSIRKKGYDCYLYIEPNIGWDVGYMRYNIELNKRAAELIDALYDMIVLLKEEGVI